MKYVLSDIIAYQHISIAVVIIIGAALEEC
jgi:hypothetical protein